MKYHNLKNMDFYEEKNLKYNERVNNANVKLVALHIERYEHC